MNSKRRKELYAVVKKLNAWYMVNHQEADAILDMVKNDLDLILYDEESYIDNIPENLQNGYRYQMAEEACDNIECAIDAINDGEIDDAINYIYNATV